MRSECDNKDCKNRLLDKDNMCHNYKSPNCVPDINPNGEPYFSCLNYEPEIKGNGVE